MQMAKRKQTQTQPQPSEGPVLTPGCPTIDFQELDVSDTALDEKCLIGHPGGGNEASPKRREIGRYFCDGKEIIQYSEE